MFYIGGGPVSWSSKRQTVVALSTAEAEYIATSHAAQEAIWFRQFLRDLGFVQNSATIIQSDNQGAISLSKNPVDHGRCKHVDIKFHFIRQQILEKNIALVYCPTEHMAADIMTKGFSRDRFKY